MLLAKEVVLSCLHEQIHELTTFVVRDLIKCILKL